MKVVVPLYGLGNVMFQYAFLCELRSRTDEACCFFVYRRWLFDHNGYELSKLFDVSPYKGLNVLQRAYIAFLERLGDWNLPNFFLLRPFFKIIRKDDGVDNFIYDGEVFRYPNKNVAYWGMWQSVKYFSHAVKEIRETYSFDRTSISDYTASMLQLIESSNSVAIHIRRGDYLKGPHKEGFATCDPEYYERAICFISKRVESPQFFVFSDDIAYAREHINAPCIFFVDGNIQVDSWQDMFLMSCCKHNIIANSTFSWWGAFLNGNQSKIVIAPKYWWAFLEKDDVVPDEWIRL
jgi:hypothetical protein